MGRGEDGVDGFGFSSVYVLTANATILLSTCTFAKPIRTVVLAILTGNSPHSCRNLLRTVTLNHTNVIQLNTQTSFPPTPLKTPVSATSVYDTQTKAPQLSSEYPSSTPRPDTP
jgi:hypothetical protein